jgi:hypothetical protein
MLPSAALLTQLPPTGILLTTRLDLPMGHPLFTFLTLAERPW